MKGRRVGFRSYRNHRLEVLDDGAEGWIVVVRAPGAQEIKLVLRNRVPNGLTVLVDEARHQVDRILDPRAPCA